MRTFNLADNHIMNAVFGRCKRGIVVLSTSILLSSMMMPAQAITVYKYVKDGIVTYSQLPPRDENVGEVEVIELLSDGRRSNAGEMAGKTNTDLQNGAEATSDEDQRIAELEQQVEEQRAQQIAEQCERRRSDLTNLNSGGRIYERGENGEKNYLDDRQIEQKRETLQAAINQYCN